MSSPPPTTDLDFSRSVYRLEVYHQLNHKVGFGAFLPYLDQESRNRQSGRTGRDTGPMDLGLYATLSPWESRLVHEHDRFWSLHNLSFVIGASVPTASDARPGAPSLIFGQRGRGTVEGRLGVAYAGSIHERVGLYWTFFFHKAPEADSQGFRTGDIHDVSVGTTFDATRRVQWRLALNHVYREMNDFRDFPLPESGGHWTYVTPGAIVSLTDHFGLDIQYAIVADVQVNDAQTLFGDVFSFAARYSF